MNIHSSIIHRWVPLLFDERNNKNKEEKKDMKKVLTMHLQPVRFVSSPSKRKRIL